MTLGILRARFLPLLLVPACALSGPLRAQQLIGYVNTSDAEITGASDVLGGQAVLSGSVSVTAKDHTAPITLGRGGSVRVCQTSVLHLTESRTAALPAPLLFALDRGAVEIQTDGTPNDSIMTPDLRFTVDNAGPLDLRLRVASNGDTCVDNRGADAPTLAVSDPFGQSMYEVSGGQHVLFEHGSLHEVVDRETSPCGCPEEKEEKKGMSIADALLAPPAPLSAAPTPAPAAPAVQAPPIAVQPSTPASVVAQPVAPPAPVVAVVAPSATAPMAAQPAVVPAAPPAPAPAVAPPAIAPAAPIAPAPPSEQTVEQAAAEAAARAAALHPFPTAVSEGLAPAAVVPGQTPVQATGTLRYNAPIPPAAPAAPKTASAAAPAPLKAPRSKRSAAAKPAASATPPAPPVNDLVHIVGRFFKKLFGRG